MPKFPMLMPAFAAMLLAGCGTSEKADEAAKALNEANAAVAANATGEDIGQKVAAMSDRERNVVFIRAILDSDLPCQSVTGSTRLPDQDGRPLWRADCAGGGSHMITITPDGTANIVSRNDDR